MFLEDMRRVYRRLFALGLLTACLIVFSSLSTETAYAAPCIQECLDNYARCIDACPDNCSDTDESCSLCIENCDYESWDCLGIAVYCNVPASYTPECEVNFGDHCENINGQPDPSCTLKHQGYFQVCTRPLGQCVACANNETCPSSALDPCPGS